MSSLQPSQFNLRNENLLPQEERLEIGKKKKSFTIGIPADKGKHENRIPLTPEAVELLVNNGHNILIESKAGIKSNYSDTDYSEMGGIILDSSAEIFKNADIILKVAPLEISEVKQMSGNQIIISSFYPFKNLKEYIPLLMKKKITAFAIEKIKDERGIFPIVSSMSEISGIAAVHIASELLSNPHGGKGVLLGGITGITHIEVVILGSGTAAEFSARAALGLGAYVKIFDNSLDSLRNIQNNLGQRLYTSLFHPQVLAKALKSADVLIGAIQHSDENENLFINEDLIAKMKKGSVIVDISADQGSCIETSQIKNDEEYIYEKHGVIHFSSTNIPSRVSRTASIALSNVLSPLIMDISYSGGLLNYMKEKKGIRNGAYTYKGILTNQKIGEILNLAAKDIHLLMAAF